METGTLFVGMVVGFVVGALIFTATGREVTGTVSKAAARRVAKAID